MKKYSFFTLLSLLLVTFTGCDETSNPKPIDPIEGKHFDIWAPLGGNAGMGTLDCLVQSVKSLDEGEMDFKGSGVDLTGKINPHTIIKGKHYYHVTKEARFGKYQIVDNQLIIVKEIPFSQLKDRRHTHAWLNDRTLLLVGSNGSSDKIIWVKIDAEEMKIVDEGELELPQPPIDHVYNTSGIAAYRKADNMILYGFKYNLSSNQTGATNQVNEFCMAFITADNMKTVKTVTENRAQMMATTAYGELRQNKAFFDENGDYYLACNSVLQGEGTTTAQHGALLRIKKGETEFDKNYNAYTRERGKIITTTYLNNGKALLYMQDPLYTTDTKVWNSKTNPYVFYWLMVDLKTLEITDLKDIPFSNGNFSQLSVVVGKKAYFGVNPKNDKTAIYTYDTETGKINKGATLSEGYVIDRLVFIED